MLFGARFWPGIRDGSIRLTFRRWRRRQAVAGRRYRTPAGMIQVDTVDVVEAGEISDAEARRSGFQSAAELLAGLPDASGRTLYRIEFHFVAEADPREQLAANADLSDSDVADIDLRLDRLDRASRQGPWTAVTLRAIADRPGVRAADLAAPLGRETAPFKTDVRKLKALGLTISLEVGYRLSPRGTAYLARRTRSLIPANQRIGTVPGGDHDRDTSVSHRERNQRS